MPIGSYDGNDVRIDSIPAVDVLWRRERLLNGSAYDMNVDGSVTPVSYSFTPSSGETWYLSSLILFIEDNNFSDATKLGEKSTITNGFQIQVQSKGVLFEVTNILNNIGIFSFFHQSGLIEATGDPTYVGEFEFKTPIIMNNSSSDFIRVRVRDNLTTINHIAVSAILWKVNP